MITAPIPRVGLALRFVALGALLLASAAEPAVSAAVPPKPINLRVAGGEENWHASNRFRLDWQSPSEISAEPVLAVNYLVRDSAGDVVVPRVRIPWDAETIDGIYVPRPGVYQAEVWLETATAVGPPVAASLRFDDTVPGVPRARPAAAWFAADRPVVLELDSPEGPRPIAGLRGYAASVDRGSGSSPCAAGSRCTEAETQRRSGIAGEAVSLGIQPEGLSFARIATVSGSGVRSAVASVAVRVDATVPGVVLSGAPGGWADRAITVTATAEDPLSGMRPAGPGGPFTAIALDGGVPTLAAGPSVTATVHGEGTHTLAFYARDAAGNLNDGQAAAPQPGRAVVRIDETPPRVRFAAAQDPFEPERLEALLDDRLSGPAPDRGAIAVRMAGSRGRFELLRTAVLGDRLVARWPSDDYPAGRYEFRATAYDLAGNRSDSQRRATGATMILHSPLKGGTAIELGFGGRRLVSHRCSRRAGAQPCRRQVDTHFDRRPAARSARYGHRTAIGGRLLDANGSPLPRLPVEIVESFAAGSSVPTRTTTVQTDRDGFFQTHLSAGASRTVEARFAGTKTLSRAGSRIVRLGVLGSVRLRASRPTATIGGRPVVFSGRLASAASGGRSVELQFRVAGLPWGEFRTVQTDARGRFRYPYAFADDDSRGVRFQFRAFVPAQDGWPYEPAASQPVPVTGR